MDKEKCPVCGNVDAANRNDKRFACTCCGHTDDADHVGALNIKERGDDKEIADIFSTLKYSTKERHKAIKDLLNTRHDKWWADNMVGAYI